MIARSQTSEVTKFERGGAEAVVYDLSKADCVTITVPIDSRWTSQPHWHEAHTEYLQVLQGRAFVRLGNRAGVCEPEDGVIEVPKYTVHEWHRDGEQQDPEDLIVREWTMPEDRQKEVFFRNLNSFLTEPQPSTMHQAPWILTWLERWVVPLQLFSIFRAWDNWPLVYGDDSGLLSWTVTHLVLGLCAGLGYILGLRPSYKEYVKEDLLLRAIRESGTKKTR